MVDDELSSDSNGFLLQIENNIVESHWTEDKSGNYLFFVLIRYSEEMIRDMQRLSKGAKVIAILIEIDEKQAVVELTECNQVCVTFVRAKVSVTHFHKWAKLVTLFFRRMDEKSNYEYEIRISPLHICGQAQQIRIDFANWAQRKPLIISNTSRYLQIHLYGFDEIGRTVKVFLKST
jgi:hypothetical protein